MRRLADGNCWMVDNLAYGGATAQGEPDKCTTAGKPEYDLDVGSFYTNVFGPETYGLCHASDDNTNYGYFYNYQAATQYATSYPESQITGPQAGVQGLCPENFVLPTKDNFMALDLAMGGTGTGSQYNLTTLARYIDPAIFNSPYPGFAYSTGNTAMVGERAAYWASTELDYNNGTEAYMLYLKKDTGVDVTEDLHKSTGYNIRCLVGDQNIGFIDSNIADILIDGVSLIDYKYTLEHHNYIVDHSRDQVNLKIVTADPNALASGDLGDFPLAVGANNFSFTATARDEQTTTTREITIHRKSAPVALTPIPMASISAQFVADMPGCSITGPNRHDYSCPDGSTILGLDERDNKTYTLRKLPDGKLWMVDNLAYGGDLATGGTDACLGKNTLAPTPATPTNIFGPGTYGDCFDPAGDVMGYNSTPECKAGGSLEGRCGYFYNWQAAMQDPTAIKDVAFAGDSTNTQGICPDGWRIPTANKVAGTDFHDLDIAFGGNGGVFQYDIYPISRWNNPDLFNGVLAGIVSDYYDPPQISYQGNAGYWWGADAGWDSAAYRYSLERDDSTVGSSMERDDGVAIRCVKKI